MKLVPAWLAGSGLLLGGTNLVVATADGDPNWWRLAANASNLQEWTFCNLRLYGDKDCTKALPGTITARRSAAGAATTVGSADAAVGRFSYTCAGNCQPLEPWLAFGFSQPVVVHCLRYDACSNAAAPTTTSRPATTTSPAPTTTTTEGTTTTEWNPFLDLEGFGRRLSSPDQMVLHRSADSVSWSHVATWESPQPGAVVSLASSTYQPTSTALNPSWNPAPDGCNLCGLAGRGIGKQASLDANFGRKVYPGIGNIEISRGEYSTLTMPAASSPWFQTSGNSLLIVPQAVLAPSGSCVRIRLLADALQDADGVTYEPDPFGGHTYEACVEDYQPPQLRSSDPPNTATGVDLQPTLRLNFDEEVRLVDPSTATATLSAKGPPAGGGNIPPTQIIDLAPAMLRIWDPNTGASVLDVTPTSALEAQTSYELEIRGDVIEDVSGNPWEGGIILFTTQCSIYGCADATTAPPTTQETPGTVVDAGPSTAVLLIVTATLTILCAFGVGVFQLYVRKQIFAAGPSKSQVRPFHSDEASEGRTTSPPSPVSSAAPRVQPPPAQPETGPEVQWNGPSGPFFEGAGSKAPSPERPQAHWRGKAREAEDIGGRGSRADFGARSPNQPYTDDSAAGGEWVKHTDPNTGQPYWQHYRTQEKRYDNPLKPDRSKDKAPAGPSGFHSRERHRGSGANPAPPKKEPEPPKPLSDNPEVAAILVELNAQLEKTHKEDIASRKKTFKFSCLRWHPDKNPDSPEVANEVFQWLQSQRDWYLKE